MKNYIKNSLLVIVIGASLLSPAMARDTELHLPFAEVLEMPEAQAKLDGSVLSGCAEDPQGVATPEF